MFKVGVTGGIGTGKSLVCKIFRCLDVPVYDADAEARRIMAEDPEVRMELRKNFGDKVFRDSQLDRTFLAARIFSDSGARHFVNNLVHPVVREDFNRWMKAQEAPYVIEEAALLFESGAWKTLDFNILVTALEDIRIARVMKRDGLKKDDVLARMAGQIDPEEAIEMADLQIQNNDNEFVIPQVLEADRRIRKELEN